MPPRFRVASKYRENRARLVRTPVCTACASRAFQRGKILGPPPATFMSDVGSWPRADARLAFSRPYGTATIWTRAVTASCVALVFAAPFETLRPVLTLPGQSLSSVEAVMVAVFAACAVALVYGRAMPQLPAVDAAAWAAFAAACVAAAVLAPVHQSNALHMAARVIAAAAIWALCVAGLDTVRQARIVAVAILASGAAVALLVLFDYARPGTAVLGAFRSGVAVVGTQVRASGPFQYPTIASMYLEVAFAIGLGLLLDARGLPGSRVAGLVAVLGLIAEGIVLTFTRSGLITMAASLCLAGAWQWRRHGWARESGALVMVMLLVVGLVASSRTLEVLRLRFTTEGQGAWFSARIDAPATLAFDTGQLRTIELRVTNVGRATWDPAAPDAVRLSYHWLEADSDRVIVWEGSRTVFGSRVSSGGSATLRARVRAPGLPGKYRLLWDIEQPKRLWFSTEPGAQLWFTRATVSGAPQPMPIGGSGPARLPQAAVRPGRVVLWSAALGMVRERPLLGVGPDNYRLLYGPYAQLERADPRVHSNNMYVEVLAGAGIVGAAAFLPLLVCTAGHARTAFRTSALGCGVAAACVAIAVHGLVDSFLSFTGTYILFAITIGLAAVCARSGDDHAHRI